MRSLPVFHHHDLWRILCSWLARGLPSATRVLHGSRATDGGSQSPSPNRTSMFAYVFIFVLLFLLFVLGFSIVISYCLPLCRCLSHWDSIYILVASVFGICVTNQRACIFGSITPAQGRREGGSRGVKCPPSPPKNFSFS
jgi:hypothetical protein